MTAFLSKREPTAQNSRVGTNGNVTLGAERILFKKALDRMKTDFYKNYDIGLCIFFECTLYQQTYCSADLEEQN